MNPPDLLSELRSLALGVRALSGVFTLILCYLNLSLVFRIGHFEAVFRDMLGNRPLPLLTELIIKIQNPLLLFSLALPVSVVLVLWKVPSHKRALIFCSGVMGVCLVQLHLVGLGLYAPLMGIITSLTAGS